MSATTMRYYKMTLAYLPSRFDNRVRDANKYIRTKISRRKIKQALRTVSLNFKGMTQN